MARTPNGVSSDVDLNFSMRSGGTLTASVGLPVGNRAIPVKRIPWWSTHCTIIGGLSARCRRGAEDYRMISGMQIYSFDFVFLNISYKISDRGMVYITANPQQWHKSLSRNNLLWSNYLDFGYMISPCTAYCKSTSNQLWPPMLYRHSVRSQSWQQK